MSQRDPLVSQALVVLVTGCSSGVGRQYALTFRDHRCRVFASARNLLSLDSLEAEGIEVVQLDVKDSASIEHAVDWVIEKAGRIDILVNNAGLSSYWPAIESSMEETRHVMETNFFGMVALTQAVVKKSMIPRRSGKILQMSSMAGETTTPWNAVYGASKAAVTHWTDALRVEVAPFNIKVITAKPGGIKSDIAKNATLRLERTGKSLYDRIWDHIVARVGASQRVSMPTDKFVELVVGKVLSDSPPINIITGGNSFSLWLASFLPSAYLDRVFSKKFGLDELSAMVKAEKKTS